ncbi:MAG: PHP domain-containing protein [Thermoplasmata archaeon]
MNGMLMDFHIHSKFSDGLFSIEDIINYAKEKNFQIIGITDHYETIKTVSIPKNNLLNYISVLHIYKKNFNLKSSLEIDFSPRTSLDHLPYDELNSLDYLLFEYVQDPLWNGYPFWKLIEEIDKIHIPIGLAHNHIMKNFKDVNINEFLDVLESHKIFIEINTNKIYSILGEYFFNLSEEFFKMLKNRDIPVSVGSDMHTNLMDMLNVDKGFKFIENLGLERNFQLFLDLI